MSDGLTEARRAGREKAELEEYISVLCDYLDPKSILFSEEKIKKLRASIEMLPKYMKERFAHGGLITTAWWTDVLSVARNTSSFQRLKALSPFADKVIFFASKYHDGAEFPQVVVEDTIDLARCIGDNREVSSGKYLVVMGKPEFVKLK